MNDLVSLSISPHPFAVERMSSAVASGSTIAEIIENHNPHLALHAHVYIDGAYVPQDRWHLVRPKAGTTVSIRMVPMGGGGGKNPLRTILPLAVMAASPMLTAGLTTVLGASTASFMGISAGRLITAGVSLVGRLAINALAPPGRSRFANDRESPTLFIQGARNNTRPFGRVPMVLGRHRLVPPLGANPYTETAGNDQYLRMLFVWGYGPLEISDLKIGETPLSDFDDVEIETRKGYADDAPLTLYSNSILQNDMNVKLTSAEGFITRTTETDADEITVDITCPTGMFIFGKKGDKIETSVQLEVQYAPTGTEAWSAGVSSYKSIAAQNLPGITKPTTYSSGNIAQRTSRIDRIVMDPANGTVKTITGRVYTALLDGEAAAPPALPPGYLSLALVERRASDATIIPNVRITDDRSPSVITDYFENPDDFVVSAGTANTVKIATGGLKHPGVIIRGLQASALRRSITFRVTKGQYDVRIRRLTADAADDNTFNDTYWTALKTIRHAKPISMNGLAMTAIRIKATDQLNGIIDRFNGVVQSLVPDYTGTAWQTQPTSNPAALFRYVLQGVGNARPLDNNRLSLPRIEEWHDRCRESGYEFNAVIDTDLSVREVLQDIAAAGRASPAVLDGKWAVIEDIPQSVPVQHFTPANTFGFKGEKSFDEIPHALRVRFINRDKGWIQDERLVYDDGYNAANATRYDSLDLTGITSSKQAWKAGRYHIAAARLRPESFSFLCDIEHIVCTRGDLIRFSHDVPLIGLASGRVKDIIINDEKITGLILDNIIEMEAGKTYAMRLRLNDGSSLVKPLITTAGQQASVDFAEAENVSAQISRGTLFQYGLAGRESLELIVKAIEPQSNLTAKIVAVDAAPAVHTADSGDIPAYQSGMTIPLEMMRPPTPVLASIQSGAEAVARNNNGRYDPRILITLAPPAWNEDLKPIVLLRANGDDRHQPASLDYATASAICICDIAAESIYDIQIKYAGSNGSLSSGLNINAYRVEGLSGPPSDVVDFSMSCLGDTAHFSWQRVGDIDLDHYCLRFTPQVVNATWESSTDLISVIPFDATGVTAPAMSGTYLIKAVDQGGKYSDNATLVVSTTPSLTTFNAILAIEESPNFRGTHYQTGLSTLGLQLAGADSIDDWEDLDLVSNIDIGNKGVETYGEYTFSDPVDLGGCYLSRLTAQMMMTAMDMGESIDNFSNIDLVESIDQSADPAQWQADLWMSSTEDDPNDPDAAWSAWSIFVIGDIRARGFRFKIRLQSVTEYVTPLVQQAIIYIDMPDRIASDNNIITSTGTYTASFSNPFRTVPAIAITAHNLQTGDYWQTSDIDERGFSIRFFNASGTGVSRLFDYVAKGAGISF